MFAYKSKQDSVSLSVPTGRRVRGYEVKRMPIGAYLRAMTGLRDFPAKALESVFPGMSIEEIVAALKTCDAEMIGQMLLRALGVLPDEIMALLAELTGIPREDLLTDEAVGLDGLVELIDAWIEVNEIENFTVAARGLWEKTRGILAANNGSKK